MLILGSKVLTWKASVVGQISPTDYEPFDIPERSEMTEKFLAELEGKITGTRVLPAEGAQPHLEFSYSGGGTFNGRDVTDVITYVAKTQTDGLLFGTEDGVITASDGQDHAVWHGTGVGRMTDGAVTWSACITIQSASPALRT